MYILETLLWTIHNTNLQPFIFSGLFSWWGIGGVCCVWTEVPDCFLVSETPEQSSSTRNSSCQTCLSHKRTSFTFRKLHFNIWIIECTIVQREGERERKSVQFQISAYTSNPVSYSQKADNAHPVLGFTGCPLSEHRCHKGYVSNKVFIPPELENYCPDSFSFWGLCSTFCTHDLSCIPWHVLLTSFSPLFQTEVAAKLREKENAILARINKIHHVAEN